jgi:hypothetical protein
MLATRTFLRPAKTLARCLRAYVDIIPDSQLLLVDVRRVLYFFFRMHANAVVALRNNRDHPEDPSKDLAELYNLVDDVRGAVLQAIGATEPTPIAPAANNRSSSRPMTAAIPILPRNAAATTLNRAPTLLAISKPSAICSPM